MSKSQEAFRTISEVAEDLNVPKHVLRFWEVKFPQIKPMKRGGGRRFYRPEDLELLRGIRHLLHAEGYTIKGVQKILREQGIDSVKSVAAAAATSAADKRSRASRKGAKAAASAPPAPPPQPAQAPAPPSLTSAQRGHIAKIIAELEACRKLLQPAVIAEAAAPARKPRGGGRARARSGGS
jgi:DNA-binding transcriptional MerR regulator